MTRRELKAIAKRDLAWLGRKMGDLGRNVGRASAEEVAQMLDLERATVIARETIDMLEGRA